MGDERVMAGACEEGLLEGVGEPASECGGGGDEGGAPTSHVRPLEQYSAREIGLEGERLAASFLERRGYEILERNWRTTVGEADIVALAPPEAPCGQEGWSCPSCPALERDECPAGIRPGEPGEDATPEASPPGAAEGHAQGAASASPTGDTPADLLEQGPDLTERQVVLVEVKTRLVLGEGADAVPELAVGRRKQHRYRRIALMYLALHSEYSAIRFDVIAINIAGERVAHLRHLLGAFSWED